MDSGNYNNYNISVFTLGGLGVEGDEDNTVRGTVSLNSISLGLKKVYNYILLEIKSNFNSVIL